MPKYVFKNGKVIEEEGIYDPVTRDAEENQSCVLLVLSDQPNDQDLLKEKKENVESI